MGGAGLQARRAGPAKGATPPTILDVMDHPALFGPMFRGDSWDAWRVLLRALFGLPMDAAALAAFSHHTGRTVAPTVPFREAALVCGRRGGKSRMLALVALYIACFLDHAHHLAAGEVATVGVIAADRRQARTVMRYVAGLLQSVPALAAMIEAETGESVALSNRVTIEIFTAGFRASRGYTLAAVLADEVAFWRNEDGSAAPDVEILRALRPGLSSLPSSMLILASSPYAKRGALWDAFKRHYGRDDSRVLVWRGSTREMNPRIDPAIIAEAREADPAAAASEFEAVFRDDIATFVAREVVEAAVEPGRFELPPRSGIAYRAFVDPSGGSADAMTLAVAHAEGNVAVLDAVRERRPPFSPEDVVLEFAELLRAYGVSAVTGDRYAGEWPRERFRAHGVAYRLSDRSKSDTYRDALPLMNARRCELLDVPRLVGQFCSLERRTARGGRDSIDHPPGAHDDVANAVAGVLLLASKRPAEAPKPYVPLVLPYALRHFGNC